MNIIYLILKIISWIWIVLMGTIGLTMSIANGFEPFSIVLAIILNIIPVLFLVWRFKADKEIRFKKQKLALERKKEEIAIKEKLKELSEKEKLENTQEIVTKKETSKFKNRKVMIVVIAICVIIGVTFVVNPKRKVVNMAKNQIESVLKSPSTAKFGGMEVKEIDGNRSGHKVYVVTGYVDAQNGFGATVRTNFKVSISKDNGKYTVYDYTY